MAQPRFPPTVPGTARMKPRTEHWLAAVVRAAEIDGAEQLRVDADTGIDAAWDLVSSTTGLGSEALSRAVAEHFRLNVADLRAADPQAHRLVPAGLARKLCVRPLSYTDRTLVVATADPVSLDAERELARVTDRSVVYRIASPDRIRAAIEEIYAWDDTPRLSPAARTADEKTPGGGVSILVVDDDPDTRLLLRAVLEAHGYAVTEADDGPAALQVLENGERIRLMTLDLKMDEMDGLEVLERVRRNQETRTLPVIVATSTDDPEVEIRLFEAGADDFIVKPLDPRRFILRVQAVLRRCGPDG